MASKSENSEIAVLQTQMQQVQDDIGEIKNSIKAIQTALDGRFVTQEVFDAHRRNQWLERVIIIISTAVITSLIAFFVNNR